MKCSSCGKEFDEERFYRICPKCGTYNNVKRQEFQFEQQVPPQGFNEVPPQGTGEVPPRGMYTAQGPRRSGGLKGLGIALGILVLVGLVEFVAGLIMVMREDFEAGGSAEQMSSYLLEEEMQETPVSFGKSFTLEKDTKLSMQLDGVEVVCEADTFADFPPGQKLVGVKISCPGADVSYDAFDESPLGRIYVGYHQTFKEMLPPDDLKGYRSVIGDRADFDVWDVAYGDEVNGYMYVFLPADVTQGRIYVEKLDPADGGLAGIYAADFVLGEVQ